jgi:hypothetical protein
LDTKDTGTILKILGSTVVWMLMFSCALMWCTMQKWKRGRGSQPTALHPAACVLYRMAERREKTWHERGEREG